MQPLGGDVERVSVSKTDLIADVIGTDMDRLDVGMG